MKTLVEREKKLAAVVEQLEATQQLKATQLAVLTSHYRYLFAEVLGDCYDSDDEDGAAARRRKTQQDDEEDE